MDDRSDKILMIIILAFSISLIVFAFTMPAYSATVRIQWTASENAAGYKLYYGLESGQYQEPVDVGNVLTWQLTLDPGYWYFAITAYNKHMESGFSNEVCQPVYYRSDFNKDGCVDISDKTIFWNEYGKCISTGAD